MEHILEQITDWLKTMLVSGIMDNLSGMFDSVNAQVGDIVEIFGDRLPIAELANKLGTIPYEVLTSISHRVQRVYFHE